MQVEKIWRKNQTFLGAPLSSVVWYITEKMHVQLNVCFKHLRNIQFFSKPAFHSLFRAPRRYVKRIEKSGAKKLHGSWGETGIENGAAKNWLFAIYMGKPVGSRVGQMVSKIQDW